MKRMKVWWVVGLTIVVSGFILYQGTRNLETSLAISDQIVNRLMAWILDDPTLSSPQYFEWYPIVNYGVRKLAHFSEYALFGCLFAMYFQKRKSSRLDVVVYSWLPILMVAILDEYLQKFAGRGSLVSDVVIDSVGGIVGISFVLAISQCQRVFQPAKRLNEDAVKIEKMQWTGTNLKALVLWSERHVLVDVQEEGYQVVLITPDGTRDLNRGDWVYRLSNGTYEVCADEGKE